MVYIISNFLVLHVGENFMKIGTKMQASNQIYVKSWSIEHEDKNDKKHPQISNVKEMVNECKMKHF